MEETLNACRAVTDLPRPVGLRSSTALKREGRRTRVAATPARQRSGHPSASERGVASAVTWCHFQARAGEPVPDDVVLN